MIPTEPVAPPDAPTDRLVAAVRAALRQLAELVARLTDEQYTGRPVAALGGSIGGHVRHNLDHVAALLAGLPGGAVDYDRRDRGTPIETDRGAAVAAVERLNERLAAQPWCELTATLRLSALVCPDAPAVELLTTPERELAFVLSHTVHHNALIAVIANAVGAGVPAGFGYAPATTAYHRRVACAR